MPADVIYGRQRKTNIITDGYNFKERLMAEYLDHIKGKTILITGGAGAIGSNLTQVIAQCGAKMVIVLDNLSSSERWNVPALPNVMFVEGDIRDEVKLKRVFLKTRVGLPSGSLLCQPKFG